ncbi:MAG: PAQR family membrane homeostasis protein TrhA, partial [Beijerinckiaceae bacterium]
MASGLQVSKDLGSRGSPRFLSHAYSTVERRADRVTHVIGVAGSFAGLISLLLVASHQSDAFAAASFVVYGNTLVLSFVASAAYHEVSDHRAKALWRALDHAAVFLLIAGTYTPV